MKCCFVMIVLFSVIAAAVPTATRDHFTVSHPQYLADGNPMPPFPPKQVLLADGNPMPPFPPKQLLVADRNPMPPFPPSHLLIPAQNCMHRLLAHQLRSASQ